MIYFLIKLFFWFSQPSLKSHKLSKMVCNDLIRSVVNMHRKHFSRGTVRPGEPALAPVSPGSESHLWLFNKPLWFQCKKEIIIAMLTKFPGISAVLYESAWKRHTAQSCPTLWDPMDCSPQAPLPMEFFRQEYWSGFPFPSPGDLADPGIKPGFLALQAGS